MIATARPNRAALLVILACLAASAARPLSASAQDATLIIELAADQAGSGPAAWRWARAQMLPRLAEFDGVDPAGRIRIELRDDGTVASAAGVLEGEDYAHLELRAGETTWARGTLAFDGTETWTAEVGTDDLELPDVLARLTARFGFEASTGWLELDVATAVGNLMVGRADGDPVGDLLTLGALECGDVTLIIRGTPHGTTVLGRSGGGLALPAVMLALADRQAAREPDASKPRSNLERWLLLAASARAGELEEAARQLSRFDDPRAVGALERLLHEDGIVRLVAMHGLARLHADASIPAIAAAADPEIPGSAEVAARAIAALLPESVGRALATRTRANHDVDSPAAPGAGSEDNAPPVRTPTWVWFAIVSSLAVGVALGAGRHRRT